jgi:prefoldin subunit 1
MHQRQWLELSHTVQILVQIQQTAVQSQRALNVARQQTAAKERERRILQLTIDEISQLEKDVNLYKGVGKMYDSRRLYYTPILVDNFSNRFMMVPRNTMEAEMKKEERELTDDINSLNKKVQFIS